MTSSRAWSLVRARQRHHRALRLWRAGRLADAQRCIVRAIAGYAGTEPAGVDRAGTEPAGVERAGTGRAERAGALLTLADFQFQLARFGDAETTLREAVRLLDGAPPRQRVDALVRLANSQRRQGRLDAAEATARAALSHAAAIPVLLAEANNAVGVVLKDAGRYAEAAGHYTAALTPATDPDLAASVHHNLAGLAHAEGRFADAVAPAGLALALHRREHGPQSTEVAADCAVLGAVLLELGRLDEAEAHLHQAYRIWADRFGPDHYEVGVCLHGLGVARLHRGDLPGARRSLDEALRIKTAVLGPDNAGIAALRRNVAALASSR